MANCGEEIYNFMENLLTKEYILIHNGKSEKIMEFSLKRRGSEG
jgi:hypothetical protein